MLLTYAATGHIRDADRLLVVIGTGPERDLIIYCANVYTG